MFIVTLFMAPKAWKQHKCLLTDEQVKKMWYIHIYVFIHLFPFSFGTHIICI